MAKNTINRSVDKCNMRVATPAATTITDADTYYSIAGTFTDGACQGFNVASDGTITCLSSGCFLLNGVSDLQVDKACTITYALEKNSVIDTTSTTPHTFSSASKIDSISITRNVYLEKGDVLKVKAKSDTANTTMTANTLYLTFLGEK